jgi:predicted RNase H-like nuclease
MYVGADGCPDGWVAVAYSESTFEGVSLHASIDDLWETHRGADRIFVDVPVGLRTDSAEPRACDAAARAALSPDRHYSVFPTPVRAAAHERSYDAAKATQERLTSGSLNRQSWGIAPKIAAVDSLLRESAPARATVRECHPEVCFWAFAGRPAQHSKTADPRRAYWERVNVLRAVEPGVYDHLWEAADATLDGDVSTDDLVDAFAVALTARGPAAELCTLPENPDHDDEGLPMEMVYRRG